ncbi:MAG: DivIVA domain-containing protein [Streptococcaceae bacterium]|jgi:cell division initiation protein|nr:DivIVA domain-containing protein [Streptococcaceae bacterium]MCH4177249.1 DivIVA domain-containing protein [Streptococcaceae bacterium]
MNLSPLDIQNKSFSTKMRGYNQDEVDDFLDILVRDYEDLQTKNRELEKQVKLTNEKLEYFNDLKNTLNQSIIVAQDTADKVKLGASSEAEALLNDAKKQSDILLSNAKSQATAILTDSRLKGAEILNKSVQDAKTLARETDELKKQTKVFHQRLALMLESQLQQVKSNEWDDILQPFSSTIPDAATTFKDVVADVVASDKEATGEIEISGDASFLSEADVEDTAEKPESTVTDSQAESTTETEK